MKSNFPSTDPLAADVAATLDRDGYAVGDRFAVLDSEDGSFLFGLQPDTDGRLSAQTWGPRIYTVLATR